MRKFEIGNDRWSVSVSVNQFKLTQLYETYFEVSSVGFIQFGLFFVGGRRSVIYLLLQLPRAKYKPTKLRNGTFRMCLLLLHANINRHELERPT